MAGHSIVAEILAQLNNAGTIWAACHTHLENLLTRHRTTEQALCDLVVEVRSLRERIEAHDAQQAAIIEQQREEAMLPIVSSLEAYDALRKTVERLDNKWSRAMRPDGESLVLERRADRPSV